MTRADVIAAARGWIGTPYHHQASAKSVGCDCLGLIRGVYAELLGQLPETTPPYTRDWSETSGRETLLEAARRHLLEEQPGAARAGDILIFRLRPGAMAKHAAVLATPTTMIHAQEGAAVSEVSLGTWWRRRIVAAFAFPGLTD